MRLDRLNIRCVLFLTFFSVLVLATSPFTYASPYQLSCGRELSYLSMGALFHIPGAVKANGSASPTLVDLENLDKENIPAFDRPYAGQWNPDVDKLSDVFVVFSAAIPTGFVFAHRKDAGVLGLMYAETLVLATGGASLSKAVVERYRPFAYGDDAPLRDKLNKDARQSFFSAHAAGIASSLIFTAKVYSDYQPGSRYRPYIWSGAIIGAISGSWLRVDAGRHFPSDVAAGLLWGGLVGYSIPALHHKNQTGVFLIPFVHEGERGAIIVKRF